MADVKLKILIVAGEASGDLHAAKLVRALREAVDPHEIEFFGAAGPRMRDAGVTPIVMADKLAIVGLPEIARALPMFVRAFRRLKRSAIDEAPDAAILVDFPDFNLKLARWLKKRGIKVAYYISPQLWAWRSHRVSIVKKYVDLMITILPFEKQWYKEHGVRSVEYVGSPLATEVHATRSKEQFCNDHSLDQTKPFIALLPGSRRKEITRTLPVMIQAADRILNTRSDLQFVIAAATESDAEVIRTLNKDKYPIVVGETYDALNAADVAAITSGTATLEAAIIGTPMVVGYKTSAVNYKLLRPLISVDHFALINLIAGERIVPELIQDKFSTEFLSDELMRILEPRENRAMRESLKIAVERLGHGGASTRAAGAIFGLLGRSTSRA
jgi:lipid-A-disaccharide synthase